MRILLSIGCLFMVLSAALLNLACGGGDGGASLPDWCASSPCGDHGTCAIGASGPVCVCEAGFLWRPGEPCKPLPGPTDPCADAACGDHGVCAVVGAKAVCVCDTGYASTGGTCVAGPDPCEGKDCGGHGLCAVAGGGTPVCVCDTGYASTGGACVAGANPCEGKDCGGHGLCAVAGGGTPVCVCDTGYASTGGTCVAGANPCEGKDCGGHGLCAVAGGGTPICVCDTGYASTGGTCVAGANPCEGKDCGGHGVCVPAGAAVVCVCDAGFVHKDQTCVADPGTGLAVCVGVACSGHGACVPTTTGPACLCEPGFYWKGAECLANQDPCATDPCGGHGACVVTSSGPSCLCGPGYVASGASCVPAEDPCAGVDCSGHGQCAEVGGTPVCLCDTGYVAQAATACVAVADPCEGVACSGQGACVPTSKGATCICDSGWYAVGLSCLEAPGTVVPPFAESDIENVAADPEMGIEYVSTELLVIVKEGHDASAFAAAVSGAGAEVAAYEPTLRMYHVRLPSAASDQGQLGVLQAGIEALPDVSVAGRNWLVASAKVPCSGCDGWSDPWKEASPGGDNWYLEAMRAPTAWGFSTGQGGAPIAVGVIDGDFHANADLPVASSSLLKQPVSASVAANWAKKPDHGTNVAGLVAAKGNNGSGRTGVVWDSRLHYCQHDGNYKSVLECVKRLVDSDVRVINFSGAIQYRDGAFEGDWGPSGEPTAQAKAKGIGEMRKLWTDALLPLTKKPWVFVQAAGNEAISDATVAAHALMLNDPKLTSRVLVVGATTTKGELACYSNAGPIHMVAPGGDGDCYYFGLGGEEMAVLVGENSGTSFAAPLVAGAAALAWYAMPTLTASEVRDVLLESASKTAGGVPVLDAGAALATVADRCVAGGGTFDLGIGQCRPPCVPSCAGKQCGDNGCGGLCGPLAEGETDCTGDTLNGCSGGKLVNVDCTASGKSCGLAAGGKSACVGGTPTCTAKCAGKQCGDDGCGGSCGACPGDHPTCTPAGQCTAPANPPPTGEIQAPADGATVSGDFPVTVVANDDKALVKLTVVVNGPGGAQMYKQSTYPGQAKWTWGIGAVPTAGWPNGDYTVGLWGLDADNPALLLDSATVHLQVGPCVPNCAGKECGDDGCGGKCAPGCIGGETCNAAGVCEGTTAGCSGGWCLIPGGTFQMGSPADEPCRSSDEGPVHTVTLTRSFYMKPDGVTDPLGPSSGSYRVLRGGSWYHDAGYARSAYRSYFSPGRRYDTLGFRPSRSVP
ncbi:MAG: S8 family serine peptidase [Deltaproteobacteria bacterium]|nr:S8 family serine peptidase [Deltaproteobacteria bacterium]